MSSWKNFVRGEREIAHRITITVEVDGRQRHPDARSVSEVRRPGLIIRRIAAVFQKMIDNVV